MAIFYNVGAILGAIVLGQLSEVLGRRAAMVLALGLSLPVIPLWAFGEPLAAIAADAFLMQMGVQGRGVVPGLAYQLGILIAAPTNTIEYALRDRLGYQWALGSFEIATILALVAIVLSGRENRGRLFVRQPTGAA